MLLGATLAALALLLLLAGPFSRIASASTVPIVFPLERRVTVVHLFMVPRTGHLHEGIDLWAPKMTKVTAVVSGTVTLLQRMYLGKPWYALWLAGDDGHGYYYSHLNNDTPGTDDGNGGLRYAFAPGLASGDHVRQGQFIAYLGDSGNAEASSPHTHFEVHETGEMSSRPMDPYDSLYRAALANGTPAPGWPSRTLNHYEQTDTRLTFTGAWKTVPTTLACGGSYSYADSRATALVWFEGTGLEWIATKGATQGRALVSVDGGPEEKVDLHSPSTLARQKVWSTGVLAQGTHTISITWTGERVAPQGGSRVNIDAFNVRGKLIDAPRLATIQQSAGSLKYAGTWTASYTTSASGGSYRSTDSRGASVTMQFTGMYAALVAKTGPAYGLAEIVLDGGDPVLVDLYSKANLYRQKVWNTGMLEYGIHLVTVRWTGAKNRAATGTRVDVDAFQSIGGLNPVGSPPQFGPEVMGVIP